MSAGCRKAYSRAGRLDFKTQNCEYSPVFPPRCCLRTFLRTSGWYRLRFWDSNGRFGARIRWMLRMQLGCSPTTGLLLVSVSTPPAESPARLLTKISEYAMGRVIRAQRRSHAIVCLIIALLSWSGVDSVFVYSSRRTPTITRLLPSFVRSITLSVTDMFAGL